MLRPPHQLRWTVKRTVDIFVPGLLVQLGMLGAAFIGFGLLAEYRAGVLERHRVTRASHVALLTGRVLQEVVTLVVQASILIGVRRSSSVFECPWPAYC